MSVCTGRAKVQWAKTGQPFLRNSGAPQESIQGSRFKGPPKLYREKTPTGLAALVRRSVSAPGPFVFGALKVWSGAARPVHALAKQREWDYLGGDGRRANAAFHPQSWLLSAA